MNALVTTRAAEGLDRLAWTVADVKRLVEHGFLDEDASFELWEGELVPMQAKLNRHEIWQRAIYRLLARALPEDIAVSGDPSVFFAERTFLQPDVIVVPAEILPEDIRGPDLLLVVEVASTSLRHDLSRKAKLYASFGVRHYWVLDAERRRAFVHVLLADGTYGAPVEHGPEAVLVTPFEPAVRVPLASLG